jgi:hypothetical protein
MHCCLQQQYWLTAVAAHLSACIRPVASDVFPTPLCVPATTITFMISCYWHHGFAAVRPVFDDLVVLDLDSRL